MKMGSLRFSTLMLVAALLGGAAAQSNDCTNVVISMSPCLSYGNSSAAPSAACCTQLSTVARSRPQCLCQVIDGGSSDLGLTVDQTQAQALPKSCNVQIPNASKCKGDGSRTGTSSPGNGSTCVRLTNFCNIFLVVAAAYVLIFTGETHIL